MCSFRNHQAYRPLITSSSQTLTLDTLWLRLCNRWNRNVIGFWHAHRWLLYLFLLALWADALSTSYFMVHQGIDAEIHPLVKALSWAFGPHIGPLLGAAYKAIAGITLAILGRRYARHLFIAAIMLSAGAAWYNIWGIWILL